uniref:Receptor L-domain domain-containing protein n=1 Tax=Romanomermis culicivorax TaxID=13658 RepID=A0A915I0V5_ROMCU
MKKVATASSCLILIALSQTSLVSAIFWRECANTSRCICSGTDFKLNKLGLTDRMEIYKKMYRNCTVVHGNLELTYFEEKELEPHGKNALNFLEHIEEVMGYVLIAGNKIQNLSLPNLRVIWGDHLYQPEFRYDENPTMVKGEYGLAILNNNLTNLDLSSLTGEEELPNKIYDKNE